MTRAAEVAPMGLFRSVVNKKKKNFESGAYVAKTWKDKREEEKKNWRSKKKRKKEGGVIEVGDAFT